MFVRTASERDLPAVSRLAAATAHATLDPLCGIDFSVAALRRHLDRPRSEFLVADDGEAIAGVAFAGAVGEDMRIVRLDMLLVRSGMQGRGIGRMLLEEIEASFFESSLLRLEVDERNARAIAFYLAAGFAEVDRKQGRDIPDTLLILEKSLL